MSTAQREDFAQKIARIRWEEQRAREMAPPIEEPDIRENALELARDVGKVLGFVAVFLVMRAVLWLFLDDVFPPGFMNSGFAAMASLMLFMMKSDSSKSFWGGGLAGVWIAVLAGPYLADFAPTWALWLISPGAAAPLP